MSTYLTALFPTPLLNRPDFDRVFGSPTPILDEKGLFRPLEMVALPETTFSLEEQVSPHIYRVTTLDYPHGSVYLDIRSTKRVPGPPPERERSLPPTEKILSSLTDSLGLPYIWGGNWGQGLGQFCSLYSTPWILAGVDCSGLLYEATNGFTPRNTSALLSFGKEVSSINDVKPLDMIIWPGHVIIVIDPTTTIESLYGKGVILSRLNERVSQISHQNFIIRRFI